MLYRGGRTRVETCRTKLKPFGSFRVWFKRLIVSQPSWFVIQFYKNKILLMSNPTFLFLSTKISDKYNFLNFYSGVNIWDSRFFKFFKCFVLT